jgi:hypothetical protein
MGQGFWVLIWDSWGSGLNMINPRLYTNEEGNNWFSYNGEDDREAKVQAIVDKCCLELHCKYKFIWSN